jgi:glycosyltransferase involved in cell wall biosynthesis
LTLARGLRERKHVQVIATPPASELGRKAREEGFTVAPLSALRKRLEGIQIVHAHSGRAQTLAWAASVGFSIRRIVTRHVAFDPRHPLVHRLKYTYMCDGIIAVSQAARSAAIKAGVPGNRIEIIPTGVEFRELPTPEQRVEARRAWKLEPGDFAVGHLGAFTQEKGQDVAAQAFGLLEGRMANLRMILAGEGPMRATLQASRPSNPARLIFPGHIEDPSRLLAALDLFIMPSRSEAWGLAALEAMASGLPVIASNTGGLAEMIDAGQTGWLISQGDSHALADAIREAAADRERLRAMGLLARSRARRFSVEETARRTEEFYLRILNGS